MEGNTACLVFPRGAGSNTEGTERDGRSGPERATIGGPPIAWRPTNPSARPRSLAARGQRRLLPGPAPTSPLGWPAGPVGRARRPR
ncbi:unnamed protein product [Lampetra fluviatilis]